MLTYSALEIAEVLLSYPRETTEQRRFTHLKLQKLLWYCQGFHLGYLGEPSFTDVFHAWQHGPVVESVYEQFKNYTYLKLPISEVCRYVPKGSYDVIDSVWKAFGSFSEPQLEYMTIHEDPYKNAIKYGVSKVIPIESIRKYFSKVVTSYD